MDERTITIILRLIHILAGIFWVGSVFLMAGFVVPALRATGPQGGRFMQTLMQRQRLPVYLGIAMLLTVLSGGIMYGRMAAATEGTWAGTAQGITLGVGGLAAILGAVTGAMFGGSAGRRLAALGQSIGPGGPTGEQQVELGRLQARVATGTRVTAGLLAIAAACMAVARYL